MKLRLTPRARLDLIGIADSIRTRNPAAALAVRRVILSSLQTVVMFPEMGRRQSVEGVRKLITR
jgi:toxin ParE1/3/4